jgi:hypothetical protein
MAAALGEVGAGSSVGYCACLRRELSGEPDAGNLHLRFDEGRVGRAIVVALSPTLPSESFLGGYLFDRNYGNFSTGVDTDRNQALRAATRRDECSRNHKTVLHRSGAEGYLSLLRIAFEMACQTLDISYRRGKSDRHGEARTSQVPAKVGQRVRCTRRESHAAARFLRMA